MTHDSIDRNLYQSVKYEEHISLVSLPDDRYIGHVTPESGKASSVARSILQLLDEKGIRDILQVIACDGTNVNVGCEGGINHLTEVSVGRPLQ